MIGFGIIREMTKEELIDELLAHNRVALMTNPRAELRAMVVEFRLQELRNRLTAEAGISIVQSSVFGGHAEIEEIDGGDDDGGSAPAIA